MDLRKAYQTYLDAPYYKRVSLGKDCVEKIKDYIKSQFNDFKNSKEEDTFAIVSLIGSLRKFIGADGIFDEDEYEFLKDILESNFDYDSMLNALNNEFFRDYKTTNILEALLDNAPRDVRLAFFELGLLICVADGRLTGDEQRIIEKMI